MDINDLYSSLVFVPIVLAILLMIFAGRRNIKVYLSKFDLVGLHLIFPLVIFPIFVAIFCAVCEYLGVSNDDGLSYIFYTMLFIIAIYAAFGFYVCIKYVKNLSLFVGLKFSLYNMIVFRKNHDKDKFVGMDEKNSNDKVLISKEV